MYLVQRNVTPTGPILAESLFPVQFLKEGKVKIGDPYHNICKDGEGECSLVIGTGDEAREFVRNHPLKGQDLIGDAANLVRIEAAAQPDKVGGNISMLLIDSAGDHPINMSPGCPLTVTVKQQKR
jgi:hypothetical protein